MRYCCLEFVQCSCSCSDEILLLRIVQCSCSCSDEIMPRSVKVGRRRPSQRHSEENVRNSSRKIFVTKSFRNEVSHRMWLSFTQSVGCSPSYFVPRLNKIQNIVIGSWNVFYFFSFYIVVVLYCRLSYYFSFWPSFSLLICLSDWIIYVLSFP